MHDNVNDWCSGVYLYIYLSICMSAYAIYMIFSSMINIFNPFVTARYIHVFSSWSGSVSSYQCVFHFRDMACNQHVQINLFFSEKLSKMRSPDVLSLCTMIKFHQCKIIPALLFTSFTSQVASGDCLFKHIILLPCIEQTPSMPGYANVATKSRSCLLMLFIQLLDWCNSPH